MPEMFGVYLDKGREVELAFFEPGNWDYPKMVYRTGDLRAASIKLGEWLFAHASGPIQREGERQEMRNLTLLTIEVKDVNRFEKTSEG